MEDSFANVSCDGFRVCDAGASPSVGVTVVEGTEGCVLREGREVCRRIGGVAVEGASIKLRGRVERFVYGRHERGRDGPVVS